MKSASEFHLEGLHSEWNFCHKQACDRKIHFSVSGILRIETSSRQALYPSLPNQFASSLTPQAFLTKTKHLLCFGKEEAGSGYGAGEHSEAAE